MTPAPDDDAPKNQPRQAGIALLATGGTIAGTSTASSASPYAAAQLDISELMASMHALPGAHVLGNCQLYAEQLAQVDSKDMHWTLWLKLRQRVAELQNDSDIDAVVILHGSDTLEETAFFLHASLALRKPLVITCAMRPADAADADGTRNMLHSIVLAQQLLQQLQKQPAQQLPMAQDVLGVCAGKTWHAVHIRKRNTQALDAFANAVYPNECAAQWAGNRWQLHPAVCRSETQTWRARYADALLSPDHCPAVATLCSHACADGKAAMRLAESLTSDAALLVETTGSGTIHSALYRALSLAQNKGITLARSSRCCEGAMQNWPVPHSETGTALQWLETGGLHSSKVRVLLLLHCASRGQPAVTAADRSERHW